MTIRTGDRVTVVNWSGGISCARVDSVYLHGVVFRAATVRTPQTPSTFDREAADEGVTWSRGWHRGTSPRALAMLAAYGLAGYVTFPRGVTGATGSPGHLGITDPAGAVGPR